MKATSPKELQLFDAMVAAMSGCPKCLWDEAKGGLVNHCASCCYKTTRAAWEFAAEASREGDHVTRPEGIALW